MTTVFDPRETWDNLHTPTSPDAHWSTDNVGEAAPGVLSPLGASIWTSLGERSTRATFFGIGVLPRTELAMPARPEDKIVSVFCGRLAIQVEAMTRMGDRLPGTSGQDIAKSMLGTVPDTITYQPTARRYPIIAWKLGRTFLGMPGRLAVEPPRFQRWWRESLDEVATADVPGARRILATALEQFYAALVLQSLAVAGHAQIMYEVLHAVLRDAGVGDFGVLSGSGGAELAVIADVWRAAQGQLTVEQVLREHGFHGPLEGEVSSVVWRENPAPLRRLVSEYANREDPRQLAARAADRLPAAQAEVLAALPRAKRLPARRLLDAAARRIPLRGYAKRSFLQGIDVIRASVRRIGQGLAADGVLAQPDDVFYLTIEEIHRTPPGAEGLVARRRERREQYLRVSIPGAWRGLPTAVERADGDRGGRRVRLVEGLGVSAGVAEGTARVVRDPGVDDVRPDEILVAPTTDPSWASLMYISAGLVVDIGGPISHAAVVARELGMPCVVNTRTGTRDIRTGDRVRINGSTGTIDILEPAGP